MPQSAPKNALGPTLKEIRLARGWTLKDVSSRLGMAGMSCTARQVARIEAQQRIIADFELLYLCAALEVTQDELGERLKQAMARRPRAKKM